MRVYPPRHWPALAGCELVKGVTPEGHNTPGLCPGCGEALAGRRIVWCSDECEELVLGNHVWGFARNIVLRDANYRCALCGGHSYEVDHIEAANGRHGEFSCIHHRSNLRALCRSCHRQRTAEQRATNRSRAERARRERRSAAITAQQSLPI